MFIADTHSDTLFSLGVMKRPLEACCITPQRLLQGGVNLQTFALWSGPKGPDGDYEAVAQAEYDADFSGLQQAQITSAAVYGQIANLRNLHTTYCIGRILP